MKKESVTEVKVGYDPQMIEGILSRIDNDPAIAPKGIAQIEFYHNLVSILRFHKEMIELTREKDVPEVEEVPIATEETVWSAEDAANASHDGKPAIPCEYP